MTSWIDFLQNSKDFIKKSEILNDTWFLVHVNDDPGGSYLRYKKIQRIQTNYKGVIYYHFEYNVVYSISYAVPMLYFNVQDTTGNIMRLEEFSEIFLQRIELDKAEVDIKSALTQMEHPLLFRPFLAIHPCRTSTILSKTPMSKNKLITFISVLGPLVFLDLDMAYGKD